MCHMKIGSRPAHVAHRSVSFSCKAWNVQPAQGQVNTCQYVTTLHRTKRHSMHSHLSALYAAAAGQVQLIVNLGNFQIPRAFGPKLRFKKKCWRPHAMEVGAQVGVQVGSMAPGFQVSLMYMGTCVRA